MTVSVAVFRTRGVVEKNALGAERRRIDVRSMMMMMMMMMMAMKVMARPK